MPADHYDWLIAAARRHFRTADATPVVVDAVRRAKMDPGTGTMEGQETEVHQQSRLRPSRGQITSPQ